MWQELLIDLRAAVRTRHPAALDTALRRIAAHPQLAANGAIPARLEQSFLLPAGEALARESVPVAVLRGLQNHPLAMLRALGAVALARRYAAGSLSLDALRPCGLDPRFEVRRALGRTLASACSPQALFSLGRAWLRAASPRLRHSALLALRGAAASRGDAVFPLLEALPPSLDAESGEALASLLTALAQNGHPEAVLDFVECRALAEPPDLWLVGRVLSGKWAAAYVERITALLDTLQARHGERRYFSNVRRALRRHAGGAPNLAV